MENNRKHFGEIMITTEEWNQRRSLEHIPHFLCIVCELRCDIPYKNDYGDYDEEFVSISSSFAGLRCGMMNYIASPCILMNEWILGLI